MTTIDWIEERYPDYPVALRRKWLQMMQGAHEDAVATSRPDGD